MSLATVARLAPIPGAISTAASVEGDAFGRIRLFDALVAVLDALVRGPRPGLLWIDDLHLADARARFGGSGIRPGRIDEAPSEIRHRLGLSHSTVKHHLANARSKVGATTTAQLVWILASRLPEPEGKP